MFGAIAIDTLKEKMLMCRCMLNKRTQILLDQNVWQDLAEIAREKQTSIGQLVRQAIEENYFRSQAAERLAVVQKIRALRPKFRGRLDYEALIENGRKI